MEELPDIAPFQRRLDELDAQMAEPAFYANPRRAAEVSREQQKLQLLVADYREHARLLQELVEAAAMGRDPAAEADLRELAAAELPELERRCAALKRAVLLAMIPPDPTDSRNTVMEIRAGTGGDEASLFAAELLQAQTKGILFQSLVNLYKAMGGGWVVKADRAFKDSGSFFSPI